MVVELSGLLAVERKIAALARPHGVVGREQLLDAGIGAKLIDKRVEARWLRPMHRGVYAVGPVQSDEAPQMAAVLACGDGAVLSHGSAGALWRVVPKQADEPLDVTVATTHTRHRAGIRIHRTTALQADEVTRVRRIRLTLPARTLLDLAAELPARELEQALAQAERRNLVTRSKLGALLARYPVRPGTAKLRELLDRPGRPAFTRSEAEERFLDLIRRANLPAPETNVALHGYEIDFLWRQHALAVEIDGFVFHGDRDAFEADRRRDADLAARGIQVMRVTWRQIADEPEAILVRLAQALAGR
jgi:very-short-patch-repair endonuclease